MPFHFTAPENAGAQQSDRSTPQQQAGQRPLTTEVGREMVNPNNGIQDSSQRVGLPNRYVNSTFGPANQIMPGAGEKAGQWTGNGSASALDSSARNTTTGSESSVLAMAGRSGRESTLNSGADSGSDNAAASGTRMTQSVDKQQQAKYGWASDQAKNSSGSTPETILVKQGQGSSTSRGDTSARTEANVVVVSDNRSASAKTSKPEREARAAGDAAPSLTMKDTSRRGEKREAVGKTVTTREMAKPGESKQAEGKNVGTRETTKPGEKREAVGKTVGTRETTKPGEKREAVSKTVGTRETTKSGEKREAMGKTVTTRETAKPGEKREAVGKTVTTRETAKPGETKQAEDKAAPVKDTSKLGKTRQAGGASPRDTHTTTPTRDGHTAHATIDKPHQKPAGDTAHQKPAGDTAHQKPAGDTAHQKPAGDTPQQKPAGDTLHQKPVGDAAHQKPAGDTAHQKPAGDTAHQKPAGDAAHQKPAGDTAQQKPAGDTAHQKPAGDTAQQKPAGDTPQQKPVVEAPQQKPAGDTPQQKLAAEAPQQKPAGDALQQKPVVETAHQKSAGDTLQQKPVVETAQQKPAGDTLQQKPVVETAQQKPAGDTLQQKPVVETAHQKPAGDTLQQKPAAEATQAKPVIDEKNIGAATPVHGDQVHGEHQSRGTEYQGNTHQHNQSGTDQDERESGRQNQNPHDNDDPNKLSLSDLREQHILNQSVSPGTQSVEHGQHSINHVANHPVHTSRPDMERSMTTKNTDNIVSQPMYHFVSTEGRLAYSINQTEFKGEDFKTTNHSSTQGTSSGRSSHGHSGTPSLTGTAGGAGKNGHGGQPGHGQCPPGHSPSGTGHNPSGAGHDPSGTGHDPSGTGHDPSGTGHNPSGTGHDPSGTGHDPSGTGHDPSGTGNTQPGSGNNPPGHGQPGSTTAPPNSTNGQPGGTGATPGANNGGQTGATGSKPGDGTQPPNGSTGTQNCPANGPGNVVYVSQPTGYDERPLRNLATLIAEMSAGLGPLHNIWSGSSIANPIHSIISGGHDAISTGMQTTTDLISAEPPQIFNPNVLPVDGNQGSITYQPPGNADTQVIRQLINGQPDGSIIPGDTYSINPLPIIQTPTDGSPAVSDSGLPSSGITPGTGGGAQGSGPSSQLDPGAAGTQGLGSSTTSDPGATGTQGLGSSTTSNPGAAGTPGNSINGPIGGGVEDGTAPASQFLNGSVDYWTSNLDPTYGPTGNTNTNSVDPGVPSSTPQPNDGLTNMGPFNDAQPNADQLVSAAEHRHHLHAEDTDPNIHQPRADLTNPWLSDADSKHQAHNHHLQEQSAQLANEIERRLDLIANGMWPDSNKPDPNANRNGKDSKRPESRDNRAGRKVSTTSAGFMGQLMTLLNDLNKGKTKNQKIWTYVVRAGDTFESIAAEILSDANLGLLLFLINKAKFDENMGLAWQQFKLTEGMVLYLPTDAEISSFRLAMPRGVGQAVAVVNSDNDAYQWQFDKQYGQGMEQRRQNVERLLGPLHSSVNSKYDPETGRQCITVRLGDTLRSIALKHSALNDVSLWKLLAQCNDLSVEVDSKGAPIVLLTRGMSLQIPREDEIASYRTLQAAQTRAHSPRKAIKDEVLQELMPVS